MSKIKTATAAIVDGALSPVVKVEAPVSHYVTAQGLRNLFTQDTQVNMTFVSTIKDCLQDNPEHVLDCLNKAVSELPHGEDATGPENVTYSVAQARRTEFRIIYGAARFAGLEIDGTVGKSTLYVYAKSKLAHKEINWQGESSADKDARREQRVAAKAKPRIADSIDAILAQGGAIDATKMAELRSVAIGGVKAEATVKALERMATRCQKEAVGLVKFYNDDMNAALEHAQKVVECVKAIIDAPAIVAVAVPA